MKLSGAIHDSASPKEPCMKDISQYDYPLISVALSDNLRQGPTEK